MKDGSAYFRAAEPMAITYAEVFEKEGFIELFYKYKQYTPEMCKEKLLGNKLVGEGAIFYQKSQWNETLDKWNEALNVCKKIGDSAGEAQSLNNIGLIYGLLSQYDQASQYHQQSMQLSRKIGDLAGEAISLNNIGIIYLGLGQYDKALTYHHLSMEIACKIKDMAGEAKSLNNIGNVYVRLGQFNQALQYYQQSLELVRKIKDMAGEAGHLNNIGVVYENLCQYNQALQCYQQSLEIARKIKDVVGEAKSLNNIGNVNVRLGQFNQSLQYYQQSLEISHKIKDVAEEAGCLNNIGVVYASLSQYDQALQCYQQSLEIARKIKDVAGEAKSLNKIGNIYVRLGQFNQALQYYQQSLEIARKIKDVMEEAGSLNNFGLVYYELGQYDKAIQILQKSIEISEKIGNLETVWRSYGALGLILRKSGKGAKAVAYYQKAIDIIEELYSNTQNLKEEERSSLIGGKRFVYQKFIELLLELHRKNPNKGYDKQAFSIAEKGKSRTFQELMAKAGAKIAFAGDESFKKMIEKEQQLIRETTNLQGTLTKEMSKPEKQRSEDAVKSLKEQLSKTEKTLIDLEKEIEIKYPRYADLKRPKPLIVEDLQEILKPGETVIAYAVGKEKVAVFLIAKDRFKMLELETKPEELAQLIKVFRKGLENIHEMKDLEEFKPETAYTLYQKLMAPLSAELKGVTKLYIAADDILYTLPFEALVDQAIDKEKFREARQQGKKGGKAYLGEYAVLHYLVDTYTITYLPSASMLRSLRKYEKPGYGQWTKPLIAFADPIFSEKEEKAGAAKGIKGKGANAETQFMVELMTRSTGTEGLSRLAESSEEAKIIAQEVQGRDEDMYLREKATEENVYKIKLKEARYLLFSTHGLLGEDFSGVAEPALALTLIDNPPGQDGFLSMSEVLGLDLNAELIILSACNTTGKGDKAGIGEGFAGLTRSFMYAGTRSILVTHWSVESRAARDLMVDSFKAMQKEPRPEALKKAKLKMKESIRDDKDVPGAKLSLAHPFFWAPFVIVGEGN